MRTLTLKLESIFSNLLTEAARWVSRAQGFVVDQLQWLKLNVPVHGLDALIVVGALLLLASIIVTVVMNFVHWANHIMGFIGIVLIGIWIALLYF